MGLGRPRRLTDEVACRIERGPAKRLTLQAIADDTNQCLAPGKYGLLVAGDPFARSLDRDTAELEQDCPGRGMDEAIPDWDLHYRTVGLRDGDKRGESARHSSWNATRCTDSTSSGCGWITGSAPPHSTNGVITYPDRVA